MPVWIDKLSWYSPGSAGESMWIVFEVLLVDKLLMKSSDLWFEILSILKNYNTLSHPLYACMECTMCPEQQVENPVRMFFRPEKNTMSVRDYFYSSKWNKVVHDPEGIFSPYSLYAVERSFIPVWNDCNFFSSNESSIGQKLYWLFLNLLSFNVQETIPL